MWKDFLAVFVGYAFSLMFGHVLICRLIRILWTSLGWKQHKHAEYIFSHPELPAMVGIVERALYTSSLLIGQPEFIGLWLALKVAGGWKGWSEPVKAFDGKVLINGRDLFNVFLIGNGLSVAYGVTGALLIGWLKDGNLIVAITVPLALVLGTLAYLVWARQYAR